MNIIRDFFKLYIPTALVLVLVAAWFLHARNQTHLNLVQLQQQAVVTQETQFLEHGMADRIEDARFLARITGREIDGRLQEKNSGLETIYADFAKSRQTYFTIRFLDTTGMERIRIDNAPSGPVIKTTEAMQSKQDRYYFDRAMKCQQNEVYISEFDLNREHGHLEQPLRPTLRFASPVFDPVTGRKQGIVILNFDGSTLIENLRLTSSPEGFSLFANSKGYWMLAPGKNEEWGHLLETEKKHSMPNRFPAAWETVSTSEKGQFVTPSGLFTFRTVNILPDSVVAGPQSRTQEPGKQWKILTWVPAQELTAPKSTVVIILTAFGLIFLGIGCLLLTKYRVRQTLVEAKLSENREQMLAISQSSQDAIVMIGSDDRITYWNPAAERMFGYMPDEISDKKLHELLSPTDSDADSDFGKSTVNGNGRPVDRLLEFEAVQKDGTRIPVELAMSTFQLKEEWYAVGSMRDITRRKRYHRKLKHSEETSRALLNAPTESAVLIDIDGTIVAVNEIGAHRLGSTPDKLVGKNSFDFFPPDLAHNRREAFAAIIKSGSPACIEDIRANRQFRANVYPVKGPNGTVDQIAIFARDVTEQIFAEDALRLSEQRFRDVSEAVSEFIWELDNECAYSFITEDVSTVLGYTVEELLGKTPRFLIHPDNLEDFTAWHRDTFENKLPFTRQEVRNITKDGECIWLQISGVPHFNTQGEFLGYRGAAMNITDRKEAEEALKASERKLRALAESAYDAIIMSNTHGQVSFWNHAAEQLFGYTEKEVMGQEVHSLIAPPEDRAKAKEGLSHFARTGRGPALGAVQEAEGLHKDGTRIAIERSVSGFKLGEEWFAVATIRDITSRKATEAKLRELATTDSLTGLHNRRRFLELSEREFTRSTRYERPLAMFMIDIDHFKNVNDTHGHDVGDEVLRSLAEISIMALRKADIVGRLGGEEFGVLLPETELEAAIEVADRLRLSVERTNISTNAGELNITVSIGVATMPPKTRSTQALLKRADIALYDAKQSGRNRVVSG